MGDRTRVLVFSGILYSLTLLLGIAIARGHLMMGHGGLFAPGLALERASDVLFTAVLIVGLMFLARVVRSRHVTFSLLLLVILAVGTHYALDAFEPTVPIEFAAVMIIVSFGTIYPRVLSHDLAVVFGVAGSSALVGVTMTPSVAILIMVIMSVYDYVAVTRGSMIAYAGHMVESGAVFGLIIPKRLSGFLQRREQALKEGAVYLVGSIDVALPLLLTSAVVRSQGIAAALLVAVGAFAGLCVAETFLFGSRTEGYIPAVPPIASGALLGYLISLVLR